MNKKFYESSTGFFSTNFKIQFLELRMLKTSPFLNKQKNPYFNILYAQGGNYHIFCRGKSIEMNTGDIAVFMPFEDYMVLADKGTKNEMVIIDFNKSIFRFADDNENYLRAFCKRQKGENNIYKSAEFIDFDMQKSIFTPLFKYKENNLDEVQFVSALSFLVSQLAVYFDNKKNVIPAQNSKEYRVIIYDYILRNFNTDITVESVAEKFFVSKSYVNRITNRFYNATFHETIKSLRMWTARNLIKKNNSLKEISNACGYSTYSGFYRCYTKYFGVNPVDDKKEYQISGQFLQKPENKK